ncbi:hypothetical protein PFICI_04389 [Pestalotiopsis fici W106-1]|uniref:Kelch repeat-containing protein n=1 Tax=Pestalotiopsis fici (strain W106-1 / CGMCC3.15140) TaxID=1229662 RepID=W3X8R4_PESFW|nr:uncharacterized protein PFICI_04389 [Pestalotiopsis fici W106-1]ETS82513.1 hypothetical protein PFICI_04389 [Pestalotiopsis fici W106-1]
MPWSRMAFWALTAGMAAVTNAQASGWAEGQVNATMCAWQNPRAAQIRDTLYIDGGYLFWVPGMSDGTYGPATQDNNPLGLIYTLNFSKPFNSSTNISDIMETISKAPNGNAANNLAPNFFDGAMLHNDAEFFLYGGLTTRTDKYQPPDADDVLAYELYQYGAEKEQWFPGFLTDSLGDDITRYLAFGGGVSAPSEQKAWYFGGLRSQTWGPIYYPGINDSLNPLDASNTLLTLDMAEQQQETWANDTLPGEVKGRGGVDVVWVPVGDQGILVALGGVVYPDFNNGNLTSQNRGQSETDSPAFMSTIDIFDIAGNRWYQQPTIAGPNQLALGCAVVAAAQDGSSFNIYYYGGYNGLDMDQPFNDDVWILSLPSFMWMKVASGTEAHARAGHRCVKPYPDQMVVVGGYRPLSGSGSLDCLEDTNIVQAFNLTEGKWMDSYDPEIYEDYGVPEMIHLMIGGSWTGGATMTTPTPTGWATPSLSEVFEKAYPTSKLTNYYPYGRDDGGSGRSDVSSGSGTPPWLAPVLGVVLGLVFITAIIVGVLLYRRRKQLMRKPGASEVATDENGHRILSWMRGQDNNGKAQTVTSEEPQTFDDVESRVGGQTPYQTHPEMAKAQPAHVMAEMPDTPLFEMMDTSPRVELSDTGLTPVDIINKHSHFARSPHTATTPTNPSSFSNYSSNIEHASISTNSQTRGIFPGSEARPDSPALPITSASTPPLGAAQPPPDNRVVSDLSGISNREQAHLRNISDASVVSSGAGVVGTAPPTPVMGHAFPSPALVSPPSAGPEGREDYFQSVGQTLNTGNSSSGTPLGSGASPLRRSVFVESQDDLGLKGDRR